MAQFADLQDYPQTKVGELARRQLSLSLAWNVTSQTGFLMRLFTYLISTVFIALSLATSAKSDTSEPTLPSVEQIRKYYQENARQWPRIPDPILQAFVAAEDRNFFEKQPQFSTITRQIGNWHLPPRSGKLQKIALSFVISDTLSHEEILNWYVNKIFLGQSCFGVADAATAYFGKSVGELKLEEAAYLAGLPKAPVAFHPVRSRDRAIERRNFVLSEMFKAKFISEDEAGRAIQTNLRVSEPLIRCELE
ncbi:transglycosylase domain-containing protein [Leisingera sp. ANG59]|uniref:transglycosylase domain-containing protein n=1 Tax=Leisingera sp. ANG59 TaxID=2675221 RepID=UPI00157289CD|nr:transglycosylase domain-containing protein [Leisingera sp. ANG59]NSY38934.1 hypothetical protein [Leisingera sp. ANG59]